MKPGHENCPRDVEEVQAIDGTNTGPIVAYYCNCCGAMRRREDYR